LDAAVTAFASPLPGFRLSFGISVAMLGLVVVLPLAAMIAAAAGAGEAWALLLQPRTLSAFRVSIGAAAMAAAINVPVGLLLAWVLTRYPFPGRRILDAAIDLPFTLPTAVAGIALTTLLADDGWLGAPLAAAGIRLAFVPAGIVVALVFVGLPFVVRTVQPVLAAFPRAHEEAAILLGASPLQVARLVIWPAVTQATAMGAALAFARGLGEYGSVIFIAGNRPLVSEIVPLLIVVRLEQYDYPGAAVLGTAMLALSLLLLLVIDRLARRR
jgi:sulfate/thiosulfate transport system permease protein